MLWKVLLWTWAAKAARNRCCGRGKEFVLLELFCGGGYILGECVCSGEYGCCWECVSVGEWR